MKIGERTIIVKTIKIYAHPIWAFKIVIQEKCRYWHFSYMDRIKFSFEN